jgi:hypothetical protein
MRTVFKIGFTLIVTGLLMEMSVRIPYMIIYGWHYYPVHKLEKVLLTCSGLSESVGLIFFVIGSVRVFNTLSDRPENKFDS